MTVTTAPAPLTTDELSALVRSIADQPDLWRPIVRFTQAERWWTRLEGPEGVDVWLLSWLPAQGTEPHDHGRSNAAFTVVAGTLTELRPDAAGDLVATPFDAGRTRTVDVGQIHDVVNVGHEPAVSIHAYSPPLEQMTYYRRGEHGLVPSRTVETTEPEE
ncbi:cysteine dioxygenase [Cellulomonas sp. JH27-2]|uniref:cysteine dioxygenase n=1 Tax=Cellulomonas sp. JH27-2 TaxID=2774139 RepID=UPI00177B1E1A|nr:cysteine dioxygenase family protein [Cellulomonas sp. JH27-2]MBD8058399.1 cysteine dioxygenase [Cellulomonas sp. JH27-2]